MIDSILKLNTQITHNGGTIEFLWVPSHVGISGNEYADTAAKQKCLRGKLTNKTECHRNIQLNKAKCERKIHSHMATLL